MYSLQYTTRYRKSRKLLIRREYDMSKLDDTISLLASGEPLPQKYRDHPLKGNFSGERECHVDGEGDWLLTYRKDKGKLVLLLTNTGTHSDLFR
jgi:mRNA interferase YafQ